MLQLVMINTLIDRVHVGLVLKCCRRTDQALRGSRFRHLHLHAAVTLVLVLLVRDRHRHCIDDTAIVSDFFHVLHHLIPVVVLNHFSRTGFRLLSPRVVLTYSRLVQLKFRVSNALNPDLTLGSLR